MEGLIRLLHEKGCSCVIASSDGEIRFFYQRGVADLYRLLNEDSAFLKDASVADKVIGKASAGLMIAGGVKEVYTDIISRPALALFRSANIQPVYKEAVDHIINRTQTGWCPLETLCYEEQDIDKILVLIKNFIENLKQ